MSLLSFKRLCDDVAAKLVLAARVSAPTDVPGVTEVKQVEIDFNQINSASIDIRLGKFILKEIPPEFAGTILDFRARDKMNTQRLELDDEEGFILRPGEFILAESAEIFNLPYYLSCEYKLKSSMARIGLEHLNAGWCDAGWHGSVLTLELKNLTNFHSIRIRPGDAIGQMVFFEHEPVPHDKSYAARGRYNHDATVNGIKE